MIGGRPEIVVALDWTDFDADDQSTIALHLITSHGRATPLLWKSVVKSDLRGWRNEHEDALLQRFAEVLPAGTKVTVLADRGFGDQALYELLKEQLGFDFVVRFRGIVKVTSAEGETKSAVAWTPNNGRTLLLRGAKVTKVRPRARRGGVLEGEGHEGSLAPRDESPRPARRGDREAVLEALHHRGELPRPQEAELRDGAHRHARQLPSAA